MNARRRRAGIFMSVGGGIISLPNLELFTSPTNSFTDDGTTPAENDGDLVFQRGDLGPSGIDFIQAIETNRPTHKTGIVAGQPVTRFNGTDNLMYAGDNLNNVFAGADKKFSITASITGYSTSVTQNILVKYANLSDQRQLIFDMIQGKPGFLYQNLLGPIHRIVRADLSIGSGPHVITINYDGSIDTNDGLDRVSIRVDGNSVAVSLTNTSGALFDIPASSAQLTTAGFYRTVPSSNPAYSAAYDQGDIVVLSFPSTDDIVVVENELLTKWGI